LKIIPTAEQSPLEGLLMPRLFQHFTSQAEAPVLTAGSWLPPVPSGDDYALGLECADPSLQIERWMAEAELIESPPLN
jgi:hypothetical protein